MNDLASPVRKSIVAGRDVYRMLVHEAGWTPDKYEKWLSDTLVSALVRA